MPPAEAVIADIFPGMGGVKSAVFTVAGTDARVNNSFFMKLQNGIFVEFKPFALGVGGVIAARTVTLIPTETESFKVTADLIGGTGNDMADIFHTQNHPSVPGTDGQPCRQKGEHISRMQISGRAGGETPPYCCRHAYNWGGREKMTVPLPLKRASFWQQGIKKVSPR